MKSSKQLTDDGISSFVFELVEYLERTPCTFGSDLVVTNEGYDHLREFILQALEPYSNGYVNYN
jgi:hypothetical protein